MAAARPIVRVMAVMAVMASVGAVGATAVVRVDALPGVDSPRERRPLLDHPQRLSEALRHVPRAEVLRRNTEVGTDHFDELVADDAAWLDRDGAIFFVDSFGGADGDREDTGAGSTSAATAEPTEVGAAGVGDPAPYPLASTFQLESRPGANITIYLDVNGEVVTGSKWNADWTTGEPIVADPIDLDGNPAVFSPLELSWIQHVWQSVAEDFAPFNVNVSTRDPGRDALERSSTSDTRYGIRAVITRRPPEFTCGCTGIAYLNAVTATGIGSWTQPAWAFTSGDGAMGAVRAADVAAHEIGHTFGLGHDGTPWSAYYGGTDNFGPIMGNPMLAGVSQWSRGEYFLANNQQDDLAIIAAHGVGYAPDDHGNSSGTATPLGAMPWSVAGMIGQPSDVDVFSFSWPGGAFTATASPANVRPDLDIRLVLRNQAGTVVATADPPMTTKDEAYFLDATAPDGLGASLSISLPAGNYSLWLDGVGYGDPLGDGYADYGSLGRYRLTSGSPRITVTTTGTGTGTVTSDVGGINCGATCTASVAANTRMTLEATPTAGSLFAGWTGACSGMWSCMVTLDASAGVTAVFDRPRALTVTVQLPFGTSQSSAWVVHSAVNESCLAASTCNWTAPVNSTVQLEAVANGVVFLGWSGGCSGRALVCEVDMSEARTVTAQFGPAGRSLNLTVDNGGEVTISPYEQTCYDQCSTQFTTGATATLVALDNSSGRAFDHWTGACSGTNPVCTLTMSADRSATAVFTTTAQLLIVRHGGNGDGKVTSNPAGVDCTVLCMRGFTTGRVVQLTATAAPGSTFVGWTGDCSGTSTCTVTMSSQRRVKATFTAPTRSLTVTRSGTGAGTVNSYPISIDCGASCIGNLPLGSSVSLTATPAAGSTFTGWSGACTGTGRCTVSMSAAQSVTATFVRIVHSMSVSRAGAGSGTITSSPAGISCGATCSASFGEGIDVTLIPTPSADSRFAGWSGACTGTGPCVVSMAGATSVTATFAPSADSFRDFPAPIRLVDTRPGELGILEPPDLATPLAAGTITKYRLGTALGLSNTATVALNVIAVLPSANGNLGVYPCSSATDPPPTAVFLNYRMGVTSSTEGLVRLGPSGDICVYTPIRTNVVIDTTGFFDGPTFTALPTPTRLFDTRPIKSGVLEPVDVATPFTAGSVQRFTPLGSSGIPVSGVASLFLSAVAILPTTAGTLTMYPCSSTADSPPAAVTVSHPYGVTTGTATVVALSADGGFCIRSTGNTHLHIDAVGWFGTGGGHRTYDAPSSPRRLLDTRGGRTGWLEADGDTAIPIGTAPLVVQLASQAGLPAAATLGGVSLTVTAQSPAERGWIKVWPCTDAATPPPAATNLNMAAGIPVGNHAFVATSANGRVCVAASSTVHATIDITAWFTR